PVDAVGRAAAVELVEEVGEGVAVADLPLLDHVDRDDGRRGGLDGPRDGGATARQKVVAGLLERGRRAVHRRRRGLLGEDGLFAAGEEEGEQQEVLHRVGGVGRRACSRYPTVRGRGGFWRGRAMNEARG